MSFFKFTILLVISLCLFSCGTPLSPSRSETEQNQLKQEVLQLLEEKYNQPFKVLNFKYEYKNHYPNGACDDCRILKYGTFNFKIKATNNPIITMNFSFNDNKKESINKLIDSFKKNQLTWIYCVSLTKYYDYIINNNKTINKKYTKQAEKICNYLGQDNYIDAKKYYLKHHTN
jgi:hypothetical protein